MKIYSIYSINPIYAPGNHKNNTKVAFKNDSFEINTSGMKPGLNDKNYEILLNIVEEFKKDPNVKTITLAGSSVTKSADDSSDYDVYVYSDKIPDIENRRKIAEKFSKNPEIGNEYWEPGDEWNFSKTGKPIDIMYRTPNGIKEQIDNVWDKKNVSLGYTTCYAFNIKNSNILYDKTGWYKTLQQKLCAPYPDELAQKIIQKNLPLLKDKPASSYREQISKAIMRKDDVSVNHRSAAFLASYFDILFAKNKLLHPGEKRLMDFSKRNCKILPKNFENDMSTFLNGPDEQKLKALDSLVYELKEIL